MHPVRLAWRLIRELGPTALLHQASYQLQLKSGWLKARTPIRQWRVGQIDQALTQASIDRFRVASGGPWAADDQKSGGSGELDRAGDRILQGVFPLFGRQVELGYPPDWLAFAPLAEVSGEERVEADQHWSEYDLAAFPVDVKLLWEPSRFGWAFSLSRAFRQSGHIRYASAFQELFESWIEANPLNAGPHWVSGQEVALRGLALAYARCAFESWILSAPETHLALMEVIAGSADRVSQSMSYARAQNNNHLLSEGAFLYTAGVLFPQLSGARTWRRLGSRALRDGYASQVWQDGGYIQHSLNYHRLAFEIGLLTLQVARAHADRSLDPIVAPLRAMLSYLEALTDNYSGSAPNLGPNDGAVLMPRADGSFSDMRPTIQAGSVLLNGRPRYQAGAWDQLARGLGIVPDRSWSPVEGRNSRASFPQAGLEILHQGPARGILRAAQFRSRPGHADQLHFDLWLHGYPILIDAGSYLYNGKPPWDNSFRTAFVHNTVTVAGRDQMMDAGKFLYLDWAQGALLGRWDAADLQAAAVRHDGYRKLGFIHQRTVAGAGGSFWLVVDDILGTGPVEAEVAWLLPDLPWQLEGDQLTAQTQETSLKLKVAGPGAQGILVRAGELVAGSGAGASPPAYYGWHAPTYAHKEPALHFRVSLSGEAPLRAITEIELAIDERQEGLQVHYHSPRHGMPAVATIRRGPHELTLG